MFNFYRVIDRILIGARDLTEQTETINGVSVERKVVAVKEHVLHEGYKESFADHDIFLITSVLDVLICKYAL